MLVRKTPESAALKIKQLKCRLFTSVEQETKLMEICNATRFVFNVCLAKSKRDYARGIKFNQNKLQNWLPSLKSKKKYAVKDTIIDCRFLQAVAEAYF